MNTIIQWIGTFLGWIMRACYSLVGNYGVAIVLFTLISKIVLLPVSIWVHKNSIKMVTLMPEMNRIKTNFFGDKDRIAEEQGKLYKKEKYNPLASIIPLILQLVLLIGIIEVIYHPMEYLFLTPTGVVDGFVQLAGQLSPSINLEASSVQLAVVDLIKNPDFAPKFLELGQNLGGDVVQTAVSNVQSLNMNFLGLNLSWIPNIEHGISILVPLIAGISAWFLAFMQNHINVLQSEQSNLNKYGLMIFSVCLSLFLAWFVPTGVGLYWIASNLFAVLQLIILNTVINPKKYVDYPELEKSRINLAALENLEERKSFFSRDPNRKREKQDYKRFFSIANKHIVFYSEASGFYKYFKNVISYLIKNTNIQIHYVTNDPDDAIFKLAEDESQIKPYYIGPKRIITLMMKMDADVVVMTTPDLETFHIKRSYIKDDIEYIYMFHGVASTNMVVREGAYDNFDTIFCVGQHQIDEIRESEKMYGLPAKKLVPVGYGLMDNLITDYHKQGEIINNPKKILIAPSWQENNILDLCINDILDELLNADYHIVVRPHPEYVKRFPAKMDALIARYKERLDKNFIIETDFSSNITIFTADLLITDWSGIAYEFSYTTKKPTLFIDTPMKVLNEEYKKYKNQPLDITLRNKVGISISPKEINNINQKITELFEKQDDYRIEIEELLEKYLFNVGKSGKVGAQYIIETLQNRKRRE